MTNYPNSIDDDLTISRIEDNITEIGGDVINSLRDALITVEYVLGINPQGTVNDLVTRLAVSLNPDGTLKSSALTVPAIINSMVAAGAGIVESKLSLDVSTSTLNAELSSANTLITGLNTVLSEFTTEYSKHVYGLPFDLEDNYYGGTYFNRHVASHIDINKDQTIGHNVSGIDPRDTLYNNTGLYKSSGDIRPSTDLMSVLIEINNDLINHLLSTSGNHPASFITLDTSGFFTIPKTNDTVQKAIDYIDSLETKVFETHRAELHSNGISRASMVTSGTDLEYNKTYGPYTCSTANTQYNYSTITFTSGQTSLDWSFRDTAVGDTVIVNYGGFTSSFIINSINYTPNSTYQITINGIHPIASSGLTATIEKSHYDDNKFGVLAVAPASHNYNATGLALASVPESAIIITPNCAQVTGIDIALDELDSTHYMLYIGFYPTGNPADSNLKFSQIQGIDVTGNAGATPGQYTLSSIISSTNKAFRSGGYNFRLSAFEYSGQFGLAISDTTDDAAFSIISGTNSGTTLTPGEFVNNVVGDATSPIKDPLGLGLLKSGIASPDYNGVTTTNTPTKIYLKKQSKNYNINGQYIDYLADGYNATDGYYLANLIYTIPVGSIRTKGVYRLNVCLSQSKLHLGSTIVVSPILSPSGSSFYLDYGRFTVEDITFGTCPGENYTEITVITCLSLIGDPVTITSSTLPLPVKIYFSDDSVSFNRDSGNYRRLHEIYVKKDGVSFSHMRSQFELSSGSSTLLQTDLGTTSLETNYGWHVIDVSPKLKGFTKVGAALTDFSRYVRFFITNYNSTDDTFDGYIGQPDNSLAVSTNNGATVRSRKGKVTRYYDNTGVDYVDILFQDNIAIPLTIVCPATQSRYVDIQIFQTMRNNEEFMCIGICEQFIKGGPNATLWYFQDKREFGTISEKILSSSAIKFIEASDRISKQNGVCSGFEYISATGTSITLNGGTAFIDGVIVNKNNLTVNAYPLYITGSLPSSTTVNFAICLTKDNSYELIPIADTSSTVAYNTGSVYIYTLSQILENRKDLLPIYILPVTSTDAAYTIGTPLDIRFFINDTEQKIPVVVSGTTDVVNSGNTNNSTILGNFSTLKAASNYIQYSNNIHSTIKIKGTVYITESISFGGKPVSIIGEKGNQAICTIDGVAINLSSNMDVVGVNFVRKFGTKDSSAQPYYTAGYSKATLGLVMADGTLSYENIAIKDCTFSTHTDYRKSNYSHILFEQSGDGAILANINISNNRFTETNSQLCIAFVNKVGISLTTSPTAKGTILNDVIIENNKGNFNSYIILSSDNYSGGSGRNSRGLSAYNLKISKNTFDYVWLNLSRSVLDSFNLSTFTVYNQSYPQFRPNVIISENSFNGVIAKSIDGILLNNTSTTNIVNTASPDIIICNNIFSNVYLLSNADLFASNTTCIGQGQIIISNNCFNVSNYTVFDFLPSDLPVTPGYSTCLTITGNTSSAAFTELKNVVNINNNIFQGKVNDYSSTAYYYRVIMVIIPANINNNIISNCITLDGVGIALNYNNLGGNIYTANVSNNMIYRGDTVIMNYIYVNGTTSLKSIVINDNYFDQTTVDNASNTELIYCTSGYEYKLTTQRNKNDTFTVDLIPYMDDNFTSLFVYNNGSAISGNISGWCKSTFCDISADTSSFRIQKQIFPTCSSSSFPINTEYTLAPLVLNIPYLDGANLTNITLVVRAGNSHTTIPVIVTVSTQNTLTSATTAAITTTSQYEVTTNPAIFYPNGSTWTVISVDMTTPSLPISSRYAIKSNSRTLPVYITFLHKVAMGDVIQPFKITKGSVYPWQYSEFFNIYTIKGTFTY